MVAKQQYAVSILAMSAWTMWAILVCVVMCVETVKHTVMIEIEDESEANASCSKEMPKNLIINLMNTASLDVSRGSQVQWKSKHPAASSSKQCWRSFGRFSEQLQ